MFIGPFHWQDSKCRSEIPEYLRILAKPLVDAILEKRSATERELFEGTQLVAGGRGRKKGWKNGRNQKMLKSRGCRKSQLGSTWKNHGRNVFVGFVSWTIDETSYIVMGKYANMMSVWNILPLYGTFYL